MPFMNIDVNNRPMLVQVEAVVSVYERLLAADTGKDVEIMMSDGTLWAHSAILSASSDAIGGMLKHGKAAAAKKLHWSEHTTVVGKFVLRLMYTGTPFPEEWEGAYPGSDAGTDEIPLQLVMDAFEVTKVYMVPHLLAELTEVLKDKVAVSTFNDICSFAIKHDVQALRNSCLQFVTESMEPDGGVLCLARRDDITVEGCGIERFNGTYRLEHVTGTGEKQYRMVDGSIHTIFCGSDPPYWFLAEEYIETFYYVESPDGRLLHTGWRRTTGEGQAGAPLVRWARCIRAAYDAEAFAPEVMVELAPLLGQRKRAKRRRLTLE